MSTNAQENVIDISGLMDALEAGSVFDHANHRRIGVEAVKYAEEHGLEHAELRDLLSMLGF